MVLPGKKNVVQYALTENASNGGTLCPTQPTSRAIFRGAYGVKHDTAVKADPSCFIAWMDRIWYVYTHIYTVYIDIRIHGQGDIKKKSRLCFHNATQAAGTAAAPSAAAAGGSRRLAQFHLNGTCFCVFSFRSIILIELLVGWLINPILNPSQSNSIYLFFWRESRLHGCINFACKR